VHDILTTPFVVSVLETFRDALGSDAMRYHNHVYRGLNYQRKLLRLSTIPENIALAWALHDIGIGEMATPAAPRPRSSSSSVIRPPKECPHDHRRGIEAADDAVVVVDDLGDTETVEDRRVASEGLGLALHAGPGRREDRLSALLETRLPALPAARGEPEAVDEDDWRIHDGLLTWFAPRTVRRLVWEPTPVGIALDENRVSKWSCAPLTVRSLCAGA
jgi:hypothetical protein